MHNLRFVQRCSRRVLFILVCSATLFAGAGAFAAGQSQAVDPRVQEAGRLIEQARSLQKEGKLRDAIASAEKAVALVEQVKGPSDLETASVLNQLGTIHFAALDYAQAAKVFERALAIQEKLLPADAPQIGASLNNLANAYRGVGDLAKAATLMERSMAIQQKRLGDNDRAVFSTMHNMGSLYQALGNYERAQTLLERSVDLAEKNLGESLVVGQFLNNLGLLYVAQGEFAKAEAPYSRSLAILEKVLTPNHPEVGRVLGNIGAMYQEQADLVRAEANYSRALDVYRKSVGENDPLVASTLHNLAVLHVLQRDFDGAEPIFRRALEIRRAGLGPSHPAVASTLEAMTILYWLQGRAADAAATQREANDIQDRQLANILAIGSEQQKLLFMDTLREGTDLTITLRSSIHDAALDELAATTILRRKARVLDAMVDTMSALSRGASDADRARLERLSSLRAEIARVALRPQPGLTAADRQSRLKTLDEETQAIEAQLSLKNAVRAESRELALGDVSGHVPAGSVLVEYVEYRPFNLKAVGRSGRFGQPLYAALVLKPNAPPKWVELGAGAAIDKAVGAWRAALGRPNRDDVNTLGRELDRLVVEPVIQAIGQAQRLLIAPDGALALVPFAALVDPEQQHRIKKFEIVLLSSGRDTLRLSSSAAALNPALVVANPFFDSGAATGQVSSGAGTARFAPLPGTAQEARALAQLMPKATVITGADATEARLKAVVSPGVLHVATHGFFLGRRALDAPPADARSLKPTGQPPPTAPVTAVDALARSGLALAGANHPQPGSADDGLLTAVEAASLNLAGTPLVVLSACETGVGEVRAGEGVQGLRRAFTMAGAASQVMSLWQVSDEATRDLMTAYYKELLAGKGRAAALRDVQLSMQRRAGRAHPFYWAAFIFAGNWEPLPDLSQLR